MTDGRFFKFENTIIRRNAINCVRIDPEQRHFIELRMPYDIQRWDCGTPERAQQYFEHFVKILC